MERFKQEYIVITTRLQQQRNSTAERLDSLHTATTSLINTSIDTIHQQLLQETSAINSRIELLDISHNISYQQLRESVSALRILFSCNFGFSVDCPASSCAALPPSSPSGYYWVRASNGSAVRVYCDMTRSCGGVTGGWMRVAELDMKNSSHQCPSGLRQCTDSNIRTCVRGSNSGGCSSLIFSTSSINYTSVCGRVIAYQYGSCDAFHPFNIESAYIDGVSITHGSPREHIWTFVTAPDERTSRVLGDTCACIRNNQRDNTRISSFAGNDYFCDTGTQILSFYTFFGDDPLWDGAGCEGRSTCCTFNSPPWFYKVLPHPTIDDIEMRVCRDQDSFDEDIAVEKIDVYVR